MRKGLIILHMISLCDAHCHIYNNAPQPGVQARVCNAIQITDWPQIMTFSDNGNIFGCIGIHPWFIASTPTNWANNFYEILQTNPALMVGEIGLDKHKPNLDIQQEFFITQLQIAAKLGRITHIHCVGAWDKILHIFKDAGNNLPPAIIFHAFTGSPLIINKLANEYNAYFSYSIPDTPNARICERVLATPYDRLLLESDTDNTNKEYIILEETCKNIATILDKTPEQIATQTTKNFQRIIK